LICVALKTAWKSHKNSWLAHTSTLEHFFVFWDSLGLAL
jgi:hypothetical protein